MTHYAQILNQKIDCERKLSSEFTDENVTAAWMATRLFEYKNLLTSSFLKTHCSQVLKIVPFSKTIPKENVLNIFIISIPKQVIRNIISMYQYCHLYLNFYNTSTDAITVFILIFFSDILKKYGSSTQTNKHERNT